MCKEPFGITGFKWPFRGSRIKMEFLFTNKFILQLIRGSGFSSVRKDMKNWETVFGISTALPLQWLCGSICLKSWDKVIQDWNSSEIVAVLPTNRVIHLKISNWFANSLLFMDLMKMVICVSSESETSSFKGGKGRIKANWTASPRFQSASLTDKTW